MDETETLHTQILVLVPPLAASSAVLGCAARLIPLPAPFGKSQHRRVAPPRMGSAARPGGTTPQRWAVLPGRCGNPPCHHLPPAPLNAGQGKHHCVGSRQGAGASEVRTAGSLCPSGCRLSLGLGQPKCAAFHFEPSLMYRGNEKHYTVGLVCMEGKRGEGKQSSFPRHDAPAASDGPKREQGCCETWGSAGWERCHGCRSRLQPVQLLPAHPLHPASRPPGHQDAQARFGGPLRPVCSFPSPLSIHLLKNRRPTPGQLTQPFWCVPQGLFQLRRGGKGDPRCGLGHWDRGRRGRLLTGSPFSFIS